MTRRGRRELEGRRLEEQGARKRLPTQFQTTNWALQAEGRKAMAATGADLAKLGGPGVGSHGVASAQERNPAWTLGFGLIGDFLQELDPALPGTVRRIQGSALPQGILGFSPPLLGSLDLGKNQIEA